MGIERVRALIFHLQVENPWRLSISQLLRFLSPEEGKGEWGEGGNLRFENGAGKA